MASLVTIICVVLVAWAIKKLRNLMAYHYGRVPYPPGPKSKPIIGNMYDFPAVQAPQVFAEWGEKYNSAILHAEVLGNHVVIVNSLEDADNLFEKSKRARLYADRQPIPILELMGWDYNFAMLPYGNEWRQYRKVSQQNFNRQAARNYEPVQTKKIRQMLQGLLKTPEEFEMHNKMFSVSVFMATMYGYDVKSIKDPLVTAADEAMMLGSRLLLPGGSIINVIPALRHIPTWFPGASSRRLAAEVLKLTETMLRISMEHVKRDFEEGDVAPSLVTNFYEKKYTAGASLEEEKIIQNIAHTVYGAASDTTISSTGTFFYTMAVNPDVQSKAHAEIDRVIGQKRLPVFEDRKSLPYIEAIFREVMRFAPPLPLSLPHSVTEDDYYKGYFIPKGTTVLANIWAMTRDAEKYSDPSTFKPERYLDENGKLHGDDRMLAFGFGRRNCVGRHVASSTMWLMIVSVLACFKITKSKDEDGNDIDISDEYEDSGFITQKSKFECSFLVRSPAAQNLILDTLVAQ